MTDAIIQMPKIAGKGGGRRDTTVQIVDTQITAADITGMQVAGIQIMMTDITGA